MKKISQPEGNTLEQPKKEPTFKPLSIRNFPESLKKQLYHLAIDNKTGIGKYIIKALKEHVKKIETRL